MAGCRLLLHPCVCAGRVRRPLWNGRSTVIFSGGTGFFLSGSLCFFWLSFTARSSPCMQSFITRRTHAAEHHQPGAFVLHDHRTGDLLHEQPGLRFHRNPVRRKLRSRNLQCPHAGGPGRRGCHVRLSCAARGSAYAL